MKKFWKIWRLIKTPLTIAFFLSCYTSHGGNNLFLIAAFFIAAIMVTSKPRFKIILADASMQLIVLFVVRYIMLVKSIQFPWMTQPFNWFGEQTACSGVIAYLLVHAYLAFHNDSEEKD